jgi:phage baseplate assembly protein W
MAVDRRPIGVTLPLRRGKTGYFAQSLSALEQTKSNLINLLLTRKGERVFQPDFGSDLHNLVFAPMDDNFDENIRRAIQRAVRKWLPFLNIVDVVIDRNEDTNRTNIQAEFSLNINEDITETIVLEF